MLLRLIVALVLAGLGLLWAGAVRDSLGLIYLSILCTAIAGVGLILYVRVSRRQETQLAAGGDVAAWRAQQEDAAAGASPPEATTAAEAASPPVPGPDPEPGPGAAGPGAGPTEGSLGGKRRSSPQVEPPGQPDAPEPDLPGPTTPGPESTPNG